MRARESPARSHVSSHPALTRPEPPSEPVARAPRTSADRAAVARMAAPHRIFMVCALCRFFCLVRRAHTRSTRHVLACTLLRACVAPGQTNRTARRPGGWVAHSPRQQESGRVGARGVRCPPRRELLRPFFGNRGLTPMQKRGLSLLIYELELACVFFSCSLPLRPAHGAPRQPRQHPPHAPKHGGMAATLQRPCSPGWVASRRSPARPTAPAPARPGALGRHTAATRPPRALRAPAAALLTGDQPEHEYSQAVYEETALFLIQQV